MSRLVVYVGPTLAAREVRDIAAEAEVLPPAEGGSLASQRWRAGDVVVLIDGYYRDRPAVRHKEIMHLTASGVEVVGAASMGALRAAELDTFGMRGVGQVYQMYKAGEICGDDEVAVTHVAEDADYPMNSLALVNLRYACRQAVAERVAGADAAQRLIAAAKRLVFYERTWPRILAEAGRDGEPDRAMAALVEFCRERRHDIKARDARLAVAAGRDLLAAAPGGHRRARPPAPDWSPTIYLRSWLTYWESASPGRYGDWISDMDVLGAARLYFDGYPAAHQEVLTGLLEQMARRETGRDVPAGRHLSERLGLADGAALPEQLCGYLSADERRLPATEQATLLAVRLWPTDRCPDWRPSVVARLRHHPSWPEWRRIVERADAARNAGAAEVPEKFAGMMFLNRWGVSGPAVTVELGRRGFLNMRHLNQLAQRFAGLEVAARRGAGAGVS